VKMRTISLSLLTICLLAAVPALADTLLYSSGAYNGTITGYSIKPSNAVSDQFTVQAGSDIESLTIVYWDHFPANLLNTVDMAISSTALPGSGFETLTANDNILLGTNAGGYSLYQADFTFTSIDWSGAGWITLDNATCSIVGSCNVLWDVNNTSLIAEDIAHGAIGGETFALDGNIVPEPSSLLLLGSGLLGLAGMLRRKLVR